MFNDLEGDSSEIVVWALSNTNSLNSSNPNPRLTKTRVPSLRYAIPANSEQKTGPYPLGECLNDTVLSVAGVYNCGDYLFGLPPQNLSIGPLDTGDSRIMDARYANGKLWAVLGTAADVAGAATHRRRLVRAQRFGQQQGCISFDAQAGNPRARG
ncbi:MAG: hypothetical protein IPO82_05245 [Betaproteobacteria bacterium]|nr:hypothetical protein [Betaproteobacteria bacterium]